jgi:oligopeptide/dipeptide ABC transporter ATP-binding protein
MPGSSMPPTGEPMGEPMGERPRGDRPPDDVVLRVEGLMTHFESEEGIARAVDGLTLEVRRGGTVALVGESGCGKTLTALSILRLVPPPGTIVGGRIELEGRSLLDLGPEEMRRVRGARIGMVFQDPAAALNPVLRVGDQIAEVLRTHLSASWREASRRAVELLRRVAVPEPELRAASYPHELSTGLKQRALLAVALACDPTLLIADEPTTALDVTIQAQILDLLRRLQRESGLSILFITHDMGIVAEIADRVVVMYAGRAVEEGPVGEIFDRPRHPYTISLFEAQPRARGSAATLRSIPGSVPAPSEFPPGCRFHPRCPLAIPACREGQPPAVPVGLGPAREDHVASCIRIVGGILEGP